jgi:hypothetical protein
MRKDSFINRILTRLHNFLYEFFSKISCFIRRILFNDKGITTIIPSKGSIRLVDVNKELHRIIDSIKKYTISQTDKDFLKSNLIDHLESMTFIENNINIILYDYTNPNIKEKIKSIIRWSITTIVKIIGNIKKSNLSDDDFNSMMVFLYESVWKLIIIFEEVLGVKCKICKNKERDISHPFGSENSDLYFDEKQFEIDLIKMIEDSEY